jgi:hypothetical protein
MPVFEVHLRRDYSERAYYDLRTVITVQANSAHHARRAVDAILRGDSCEDIEDIADDWDRGDDYDHSDGEYGQVLLESIEEPESTDSKPDVIASEVLKHSDAG